MAERERNRRGRFEKVRKSSEIPRSNVLIEHNYVSGHVCENDMNTCSKPGCPFDKTSLGKSVSVDGWKNGSRIIDLGVLLSNLRSCKFCRLGPIPLCYYNVIGELQQGLSGYLYVRCQNAHCMKINCVAYGTTYYEKRASGVGKPSFAINTKLGTGMINVFSFLSDLDLNTATMNCNFF